MLNVSFKCIANVQNTFEDRLVCYSTALYEGTVSVPKAESVVASKIKHSKTDSDYLHWAIRTHLKKLHLPKRIYNSTIVITFMWDEDKL